MPFKFSDWKRLLARLELGREHLQRFQEADKERQSEQRHLLDDAVNCIHAMAEYAVNANLELRGQPAETMHQLDKRARELLAVGQLKKDYAVILEQLGRYRKFAQYAGYGRSGSTHYNATNVESCLTAIDDLVAETDASLRAAGKIEG
jgi:hypothetical protein